MAVNYTAGGQTASQIADAFARAAYNNALAMGVPQGLAIQDAAEKWKERYDSAVLTGYFNDKPTMAREQMEADLTGQYNGKPTEGTREFNVTSGGRMDDGSNTLSRDTLDYQTATSLANTLAGLRGPANYLQYAKVLNGTPGGVRDIISAAAGRMNIPGFGGMNVPAGGLNTANIGVAPAPPVAPTPSGTPAGPAISDNGALNLTADYHPGNASGIPAPAPAADPTNGILPTRALQTAPADAAGGAAGGSASPLRGADLSTLFGGIAHPEDYTQGDVGALPAPGQIDPRAYARFSPTQKAMLGANYEALGFDPNDVEAQRKRSLPQFQNAQRGSIGGFFGN